MGPLYWTRLRLPLPSASRTFEVCHPQRSLQLVCGCVVPVRTNAVPQAQSWGFVAVASQAFSCPWSACRQCISTRRKSSYKPRYGQGSNAPTARTISRGSQSETVSRKSESLDSKGFNVPTHTGCPFQVKGVNVSLRVAPTAFTVGRKLVLDAPQNVFEELDRDILHRKHEHTPSVRLETCLVIEPKLTPPIRNACPWYFCSNKNLTTRKLSATVRKTSPNTLPLHSRSTRLKRKDVAIAQRVVSAKSCPAFAEHTLVPGHTSHMRCRTTRRRHGF